MPNREPTPLVLALRVYPEGKDQDSEQEFDKPKRQHHLPSAMLVFDSESRTDQTQKLTFGSYRFVVDVHCLKEALFCADDLPTRERSVLQRYVLANSADVTEEGVSELFLQNRRDFAKELYRDAYKARCLLVGFNLPFDLARVACDFTIARKRFAGGFSLGFWSYVGKGERERRHPFRPRIAIKYIDSKRALKGFTDRSVADESDLIPDGSTTGKPEEDYIFRGHFLDLRTLAFALTDRGYTLELACKDFEVEHAKTRTARHGVVTKKYIDYNRRDVLATSELAGKLLDEYEKHPIKLQPTKAYSPASIGKAYLRAMGIRPILERQPKFAKKYLGFAQTAFFGGRASAHIRKIPVPVVYTDFLSMYPTVNNLMGLWRYVIAQEIRIVENCAGEIEAFLRRLTANDLFDPETWQLMPAFVRVIPNGNILPSRSRYSRVTNDWQIAVNYLYGDGKPENALWFSLPDVVASVILTGQIPQITDAFRIAAHGKVSGLTPTRLRSAIPVDPCEQDFFKVVIEERQRARRRTDLPKREHELLDRALKVLANATSYGIYAEMHRLESEQKVRVSCHGIDAESFSPWVAHPDEPGAFCFPPLASLITGAARLMLGLLEHEVSKLGGTYAMEDTDSMAIVATEQGGMIPCPGGKDGQIKALTWKQVEGISNKFAALNPYESSAVPGSILKIEQDNRDPQTGKPRQIYCLAISAKRYALFLLNEKGEPELLRSSCPFCGRKNKPNASNCEECKRALRLNNEEDRWSEHGLGHLLNPTDAESEDREWIAHVWLSMVRKALGLSTDKPPFESSPAIGRITVSSPVVMHPFTKLNKGKKYAEQIKPFNFLLTSHVKPLGHPPGADAEHFHLIAPYESDSRKWLKMFWTDQYSGKAYRITTSGFHGNRRTARVKTYGDVIQEYEVHPESKCADASGEPCGKRTVGLLQRRHVRVDLIKYIGKESNSLEEVESGLQHSAENVYTEYSDLRRDEWETKIVPAMNSATLAELQEQTGLSRRMLIDARTKNRRPHYQNQDKIAAALKKLGWM